MNRFPYRLDLDPTPLTVTAAAYGTDAVLITFSKPVVRVTIDSFHSDLLIKSVYRIDDRTYRVGTGPHTYGVEYVITIQGPTDLAGNEITETVRFIGGTPPAPAPSENDYPTATDGSSNMTVLERLRSYLNPAIKGPHTDALLEAIGTGDEYVTALAEQILKQLFIGTAEGPYLETRAAAIGITKPSGIGFGDELYRKLVLHLANKKITLDAVLGLLEIFYGPDTTRANITCTIPGPYRIEPGLELYFKFDGTDIPPVRFRSDHFVDWEAATAFEVAAVLTDHFRRSGVKAFAVARTNFDTGNVTVTVYSGALGLAGTVACTGGSANRVFAFPSPLPFADSRIWTVKRNPETGNVAFTSTVPVPGLEWIRSGDIANIYGAFDSANTGAKTVSRVTGTSFEVVSDTVTDQAVIAEIGDITFHRPDVHTIYHNESYALAAVPGPLEVLLPATTRIVERTEGTGAYLAAGLTLEGTATYVDGTVTVTVPTPHGYRTGDRVITDGFYVTNCYGSAGFETVPSPPGESGTELLDGRIFTVGSGVINIFDPATKTWTSPGTVPAGSRVVTLDNGRVAIVTSNDVRIYDPDSQVIVSTANLVHEGRIGFEIVKMTDGRVLIWGGSATSAASEVYDPVTGTCTPFIDDVRAGRTGHLCVPLTDGRIFLSGTSFADPGYAPSCLIVTPSSGNKKTLNIGGMSNYHNVFQIPGIHGLLLTYTSTFGLLDLATLRSQSIPHVNVPYGPGQLATLIDDSNIYITNGKVAYLHNFWTGVEVPNSTVIEPTAIVIQTRKGPFIHGSSKCIYWTVDKRSVEPLNGEFTVTVLDDYRFSYVAGTGTGTVSAGTVTSAVVTSDRTGSYIIDRSPPVTGIETVTTQLIEEGLGRFVLVQDASTFPDKDGMVCFGFGTDLETWIRYQNRPDSSTIKLAPGATFPVALPVGTTVTYVGDEIGTTKPFYLTASAAGRVAVSALLREIIAAGTALDEKILYPGDVGLAGSRDYVWGGDE